MNTSEKPSRPKERRYFPRVNFRATAELISATGRWPVQLVDLSFNGALVATNRNPMLVAKEELVLFINLDSGEQIKMRGHLAHTKGNYLGIECKPSNVDNSTQLRRLLNSYTRNQA